MFGIFGNLYGKEGVREASEVGTTHLGTPGPPSTPWWVVPPSGNPYSTSLAHLVSSGPEKIHKKFCCVWTPFGTVFYDAKNKQKTTTGTGHYVNRLVPKNDIK